MPQRAAGCAVGLERQAVQAGRVKFHASPSRLGAASRAEWNCEHFGLPYRVQNWLGIAPHVGHALSRGFPATDCEQSASRATSHAGLLPSNSGHALPAKISRASLFASATEFGLAIFRHGGPPFSLDAIQSSAIRSQFRPCRSLYVCTLNSRQVVIVPAHIRRLGTRSLRAAFSRLEKGFISSVAQPGDADSDAVHVDRVPELRPIVFALGAASALSARQNLPSVAGVQAR